MQISSINTRRSFGNWPDFQIVFEWEDIFSSELGVPLYHESVAYYKYLRRIPCVARWIHRGGVFQYDMVASQHRLWQDRWIDYTNVIPCIIDFYVTEPELPEFYEVHKNAPVVLISSKEAYDWLKAHNCPLKIAHLPLSLSDKYAITADTRFEKKYDLALMGRQNAVLKLFLDTYTKKHPDFVYVYNQKEGNAFVYYSSDGTRIGVLDTREKYLAMMRSSRCGFYSLPSMDGDKRSMNGFNQVTPRILELMACGCHVIARYKDNPDTRYYCLSDMFEHTDSYESFERQLDYARTHEVDMARYADYLKKHYTSARAAMLKNILESL